MGVLLTYCWLTLSPRCGQALHPSGHHVSQMLWMTFTLRLHWYFTLPSTDGILILFFVLLLPKNLFHLLIYIREGQEIRWQCNSRDLRPFNVLTTKLYHRTMHWKCQGCLRINTVTQESPYHFLKWWLIEIMWKPVLSTFVMSQLMPCIDRNAQ
jgi:hypothetical protein